MLVTMFASGGERYMNSDLVALVREECIAMTFWSHGFIQNCSMGKMVYVGCAIMTRRNALVVSLFLGKLYVDAGGLYTDHWVVCWGHIRKAGYLVVLCLLLGHMTTCWCRWLVYWYTRHNQKYQKCAFHNFHFSKDLWVELGIFPAFSSAGCVVPVYSELYPQFRKDSSTRVEGWWLVSSIYDLSHGWWIILESVCHGSHYIVIGQIYWLPSTPELMNTHMLDLVQLDAWLEEW